MNWYKISQSENLKENYLSIGHEGYYDRIRGIKNRNYNCQEIKIWSYSPSDEKLEIHDVTNNRYLDHGDLDRNIYNFKGRYENCNGIKRISLSIPRTFRVEESEIINVKDILKNTFNVKDNDIYLFN